VNLEGIHALLDTVESGTPRFPPTLLFNEGWMLRLVLAWFSSHEALGHSLAFAPGATWFSEALLPTPFPPRYRGDKLAEARTHADGMIGHIAVGALAKADASLLPDATQLVVTEAKMFSPLSAGTRHAPTYNQAARNMACIAEMLARAKRHPSRLCSLAFLVLAPEGQIKKDPSLSAKLAKDSIERAVRSRTASYGPERDAWLQKWFLPTLERAQVSAVSWEQVIADIRRYDESASQSLAAFYERCLFHNAPRFQAILDEAEQRIRETGGLEHEAFWQAVEGDKAGI
jgi:hypothetical protein